MHNTQARLYQMYRCIGATILLVRLDWFSSICVFFFSQINWVTAIIPYRIGDRKCPSVSTQSVYESNATNNRLVDRSGPNKWIPSQKWGWHDRTQEVHQLPQTDWLIDERIIFINNSVTATALSAFVSWQQASAGVIHALYVTAYCHLNNTSKIIHALVQNDWWCERKSMSIWYTRTFRFSWGNAVKSIAHGYSISVGSGEKKRGAVFGSE